MNDLEVTLGPVPCNECHASLYYVAGRWQERHYVARVVTRAMLWDQHGKPGLLPTEQVTRREYRDHVCTAREGNPVVMVIPKGRQGRGGHWRKMVGLPRTRRAPEGRPELI